MRKNPDFFHPRSRDKKKPDPGSATLNIRWYESNIFLIHNLCLEQPFTTSYPLPVLGKKFYGQAELQYRDNRFFSPVIEPEHVVVVLLILRINFRFNKSLKNIKYGNGR